MIDIASIINFIVKHHKIISKNVIFSTTNTLAFKGLDGREFIIVINDYTSIIEILLTNEELNIKVIELVPKLGSSTNCEATKLMVIQQIYFLVEPYFVD